MNQQQIYINVFQQVKVNDINNKICCLDYGNNAVYVGDNSGGLYKFQFEISTQKLTPEKSERISKSTVDSIRHVPQVDLILVQSEGILQLFTPNLTKKGEPIVKEKTTIFCLNESPNCFGELLVITRKGILFSFKWNQQKGEFIFTKQYQLPETPIRVAWYEKSIFAAFANYEYDIINSDDPTKVEALFVEICKEPAIKLLDKNEYLLLTKNNVGVPVTVQGQSANKNSFNFQQQKSILGITKLGFYLVILFENLIQVFSIPEQKILQEIQIQNGKCISFAPDKLFFCSEKSIFYLHLTPYQEQIQFCFDNLRINDAFSIFNYNVTSADPNRQQKLEILRLDVAWALIKENMFKEAIHHLSEVQYDPREFILLFSEYIPSEKRSMLENIKVLTSMHLLINQALNKRMKKGEKLDISLETQKSIQLAKQFIIEVLENRRNNYIMNQVNLKDKINFVLSKQSVNAKQFLGTTPEELLELIDFILITLYVELRKDNELKKLLQTPVYCKLYYSELEQIVRGLKSSNDALIARFFEQFDKITESLDIWKKIGEETGDVSLRDEACEETIKILKKQTDRKMILKYLKWVLEKNYEIGMNLFADMPQTILDPYQTFNYLDQFKNGLILKELYLEILIYKKKTNDESLHTKLVINYLDILYSLKGKNTQHEIDMGDPSSIRLLLYVKKLNDCLKNPNSHYNEEIVLEKLRDSWLIQEEVYLHGKTKNHEKALRMLIKKKQFDEAEEYCTEKQDNLLTQLFKIYIQLYYEVIQKLQQNPNNNKIQQFKEFLMEKIDQFLSKYAMNSQLDAIEAIELLPEEWILDQQLNSLFDFIYTVLSHNLHKKRMAKAAKQISDMDSLEIQYKLIHKQKAYITIQPETICVACKKKISDKVFAVFPNGNIIHTTCGQAIDGKITVCPVTLKNFENQLKY